MQVPCAAMGLLHTMEATLLEKRVWSGALDMLPAPAFLSLMLLLVPLHPLLHTKVSFICHHSSLHACTDVHRASRHKPLMSYMPGLQFTCRLCRLGVLTNIHRLWTSVRRCALIALMFGFIALDLSRGESGPSQVHITATTSLSSGHVYTAFSPPKIMLPRSAVQADNLFHTCLYTSCGVVIMYACSGLLLHVLGSIG